MERLYPQDIDLHTLSPLALAFVGDGVYSLMVREKLLSEANRPVNDLHKMAVKAVRAEAQSAAMDRLLPLLTEEEEAVFKRGRNAKKPTKSKSATAAEYNRSTGFEAVLGFLHLTGQAARIEKLLSYIDETALKGQAAEKVYKP